jgi:hypothetical protein
MTEARQDLIEEVQFALDEMKRLPADRSADLERAGYSRTAMVELYEKILASLEGSSSQLSWAADENDVANCTAEAVVRLGLMGWANGLSRRTKANRAIIDAIDIAGGRIVSVVLQSLRICPETRAK